MHRLRTGSVDVSAPALELVGELPTSAAELSRLVGEWFAATYPARTDFVRARYRLVQPGDSSAKLRKNASFRTFGLAMPPARLWIDPATPHATSHVLPISATTWEYLGNVCPWADGCEESCISTTGHYGMGQAMARTWARVLWHGNRGLFLALLNAELRAIDASMARESRRRRRRVTASVRLNVTSDVQWSRYVDHAQYSRIMFYDYSKNPEGTSSAPNHDVSVSVTRRYSVADIRRLAREGRRPVVVVPTADDADSPTFAGIPAVNGEIGRAHV